MKLVQINSVCNESTGNIMYSIQKKAIEEGYDTLSLVGRREIYSDVPCKRFGNYVSFWTHVAITTAFDRHGWGSYFQTKKLVDILRTEKPDIIHLHNIHGYYLNVPELMNYLTREFTGQLVWTFHDLWPITGHCAYYVLAQCDKWKTGCSRCPNKGIYPISWGLDMSKKNYEDKKEMFSKLRNLTITVPSQWMKKQLEQSFLKDKTIVVVNNGIDIKEFDYHRDDLQIELVKEKYGIPSDKTVLLSVASIWDKRKGFKDLTALAKKLPDDYVMVIVGLNKLQMKSLPTKVIGIKRTEDKKELVALYSGADIFINPSKEESFSMVTIEAQACGLPTVVLDTSAVAELVHNDNGIVLDKYDTDDYLKAIKCIKEKNIDKESIRRNVMGYSKDVMAQNMIDIYVKA